MNGKIMGRNPILEAIKSGRDIDKIFVKEGKLEGSLIPIVKKAREKGFIVTQVEKQKLDDLAEGGVHQGVVAFVSEVQYKSIEEILEYAKEKEESPFVIICDNITDPHNLGAIIRTADCIGAHGVILPKRNSAPINEIVAKTSAGAVEYVNIARVTNLVSTMEKLKDNGMWITGADMDGESMYKIDLKGSIGIVVGSEGSGISRLVREKCDFIASIPLKGHVSSLNASVAASVLMYEAVRQRG